MFCYTFYHFTHIWTNLLTQCTQCQFLCARVYFAGAFTQFSKAQKIPRKIYKNQHTGSFQITEDGPKGSQGPPRRPVGAAYPLAAPRGRLGGSHLLWCPTLAPIFYPRGENTNSRSLFSRRDSDLRRHLHQASGDQNSCAGTLPGRGSAPGFISIDVASSLHDAGVVPPRG